MEVTGAAETVGNAVNILKWDLSFAVKTVPAVQVQTAPLAALANICDEVRSTAEILKEKNG